MMVGYQKAEHSLPPTEAVLPRLLGQKRARTFLGGALASGQLAHAYLFRGPDGVGKQLFARRLAMAVNCRQRLAQEALPGLDLFDSCGHCSSCRKYISGNHPDFMVIRPEKGTIKIDRIREMIRALSYPPYESSMRVVLLEDIHTMREEAANCLLKTLEEPPARNLLILTAAAVRQILPTISSRCQTLSFFHLSQGETVQILQQQRPEMDTETAQLLARLSEGCPGHALLLGHGEMIPLWRQVVDLLADPEKDDNRAVGFVLQAAEAMALLQENLPSFLGLLRIWLRDLLGTAIFGQREDGGSVEADGTADGTERGGKEINRKGWNSRQIFDKLQAVDQAERELARNCTRALVCEALLLKLQR